MAKSFGTFGPSKVFFGDLLSRMSLPIFDSTLVRYGYYRSGSRYAKERVNAMKDKLLKGQSVYLLGLNAGGHNAGIALIEVSSGNGVNLVCNNEEERFNGIKHCSYYPELSVETLLRQLRNLDIDPAEIHACLAGFDYALFCSSTLKNSAEDFPHSLPMASSAAYPDLDRRGDLRHLLSAPARLNRQLGLDRPLGVIGMRHHESHAYFSYAVSPFAGSSETVMIAVLDSNGDDGSISLYAARKNEIQLVYANYSLDDSLGKLYLILSSTQGGWTPKSSEGRYMGASAWGNNDRLTNPFYRQLRQLIYFDNDGKIFINRSMANWHRERLKRPYTESLIRILGQPISFKDMWNPDSVLRVDDAHLDTFAQERLDKAAAVQLLFEDSLFHIINHLIHVTKSNKLVLTGGTALNCSANMKLLEHFNEEYYERYVGRKNTRLHLWIPPTPGDAGITMGAAYSFAIQNGAPLGRPLSHAFYCGLAPTTVEIRQVLENETGIGYRSLGNILNADQGILISDLMAYIVSQNGILGVFQGIAETGPRALGHRSIIANPCNPLTREILNQRVKYRELIRPLAPMATYRAAQRWFELSEGASDNEHNAYNYMVVNARARPESYSVVPAVIHKDGTVRVQIVREDSDRLMYQYLTAMGRRVGVEISVNTSLNVGSPIVQTPLQAVNALKKSKGLDGLVLIGAEGDAFLAWHNIMSAPKDCGQRLMEWYTAWSSQQAHPI
jgi:carbamoyltransferase